MNVLSHSEDVGATSTPTSGATTDTPCTLIAATTKPAIGDILMAVFTTPVSAARSHSDLPVQSEANAGKVSPESNTEPSPNVPVEEPSSHAEQLFAPEPSLDSSPTTASQELAVASPQAPANALPPLQEPAAAAVPENATHVTVNGSAVAKCNTVDLSQALWPPSPTPPEDLSARTGVARTFSSSFPALTSPTEAIDSFSCSFPVKEEAVPTGSETMHNFSRSFPAVSTTTATPAIPHGEAVAPKTVTPSVPTQKPQQASLHASYAPNALGAASPASQQPMPAAATALRQLPMPAGANQQVISSTVIATCQMPISTQRPVPVFYAIKSEPEADLNRSPAPAADAPRFLHMGTQQCLMAAGRPITEVPPRPTLPLADALRHQLAKPTDPYPHAMDTDPPPAGSLPIGCQWVAADTGPPNHIMGNVQPQVLGSTVIPTNTIRGGPAQLADLLRPTQHGSSSTHSVPLCSATDSMPPTGDMKPHEDKQIDADGVPSGEDTGNSQVTI